MLKKITPLVTLLVLCYTSAFAFGLLRFIMSSGPVGVEGPGDSGPCISDGDFLNDHLTSSTGWTLVEVGYGTASISDSNLWVDSGDPAATPNYSWGTKDGSAIPDSMTFSVKFNITKTETTAASNLTLTLTTENPAEDIGTDTSIFASIRSNGLWMNDNDTFQIEVGDDVNLVCDGGIATGCDQWWTFICTDMNTGYGDCAIWRFVPDNDTDWVYIDTVEANGIAGDGTVDGYFRFWAIGYSPAINIGGSLDWVKVGTGLDEACP